MKKISALLTIATLALSHFVFAGAAPSADEMWQNIQLLLRQGPPRKENAPLEERKANVLQFMDQVDKACADFVQEYPNDKRGWEARLDRLNIEAQRPSISGQKINITQFESKARELVDSPETSKIIKSEAAYLVLAIHAETLINEPNPSKVSGMEQEMTDFSTAYPTSPNNHQLNQMRLAIYEKNAPAKATELLTQLAQDKDIRVSTEAKRLLKNRELQTKPLDLKFTTVNGDDFDVSKWRGKVVLVDFWATWCGPCRATLPKVLDIYKKYHPKGFEIIGISLDADKEKLLAFTKQNEMAWPQYFDGKGWNNIISSGYGINSIPRMWLLDKKGIIRSMEVEGDLEQQIAQLLSE